MLPYIFTSGTWAMTSASVGQASAESAVCSERDERILWPASVRAHLSRALITATMKRLTSFVVIRSGCAGSPSFRSTLARCGV